jgi:GT2 family glycosyltransferase
MGDGPNDDICISAVVCTRDRGDAIVPTIETILANDHPSFELIVVDQGPNPATAAAIERFRSDPRLRYVHSDELGLGRARNLGLGLAIAPFVAFTDDDVTVPTDWLTTMERELDCRPRAAVAFCNVVAGPHDESVGFVPDYIRSGTHEITNMRGKLQARGIGAGIAVRRDAVLSLGGFDALLGVGGRFLSCEDGDLAVRALLAGWHVLETDAVAVVHHGFRTWQEGRALTRRDWYGIGAAYSKPVRTGSLKVLTVVVWEGVVRAMLVPIVDTLRKRRWSGIRQGWYFWKGFAQALRVPVDRATMRFAPGGELGGPGAPSRAAHASDGSRRVQPSDD